MDDAEDLKRKIRQDGFDPDKTIGEFMEEDDRNRRELWEDIKDSPGQHAVQQLELLYTTLGIVGRNHEELTDIRDWYLDKGFEIHAEENRDELENFQKEYQRRLHNYSASVHSLINHSYTILDRHEEDKPELKERYFDELDKRDLKVKIDLLKQLRHYTQKRELPPIATSLHLHNRDEQTEMDYKILLQKDKMMDWGGWAPEVRDELQERPDEIEITHFTEEYQSELEEFYDWFKQCYTKVFHEEIRNHIVTISLLEQEHEEI